MEIPKDGPLGSGIVAAIHSGDLAALERLLGENPGLATARIVDAKGVRRTVLHTVADWPGHFPNGAATVAVLIAAGADPDAPVIGGNAPETPLHGAASSDDVAVLDALLDGGADIEAPGAIFTGGSAMSDAVIFAQWKCARRLLERGARTTLSQSAALGLLERVEKFFAGSPTPDEITTSFWHACRGGQRWTAEYLLSHGAELNWLGYDRLTPLGAARKSGNQEFVEWLLGLGAV
ncbi:MAG TPA: ankyrin repeat domain-containing protein [Bryobacteraceae bacterium]|jgi:ankyrin repeat protein